MSRAPSAAAALSAACRRCRAGSGGRTCRSTAQEIGLRITNGSPNIPAYAGSMTAEELRAIVAFLVKRR